ATQFGDVETRAAAHIKDAIAGSCAERSSHQPASAQHVASRIEPLQPLDEAPIELQLAHFSTATRADPGAMWRSKRSWSAPADADAGLPGGEQPGIPGDG